MNIPFSVSAEEAESLLIAEFGDRLKSKLRSIGVAELVTLAQSLSEAKTKVRVYSEAGFVPKSHKWPVSIEYVEAEATETWWRVRVGACDAKRPYGKGNLVVIR